MSEPLVFRYDVDGENFTSAGEASVQVKKNLRSLGISPETIRRVSIAMYEGEINMARRTANSRSNPAAASVRAVLHRFFLSTKMFTDVS